MRPRYSALAITSVLLAISFPLAVYVAAPHQALGNYIFEPGLHRARAQICGAWTASLELYWIITCAPPFIAVLAGYISKIAIRRSQGRLVGSALAIAGLCLGYLGAIQIIFGPKLLLNSVAVREATAVKSLRTLSSALEAYAKAHPGKPLPLSLHDVAMSGFSKQIDSDLADGDKCRYHFNYTHGTNNEVTYRIFADPINAEALRHFSIDHTGILRVEQNRDAMEDSPPL